MTAFSINPFSQIPSTVSISIQVQLAVEFESLMTFLAFTKNGTLLGTILQLRSEQTFKSLQLVTGIWAEYSKLSYRVS